MAELRNRGTSSVATSKALPRSGSSHSSRYKSGTTCESQQPGDSMTDQGVVVLGIPIPSSSPLFLSIVALHVTGGIVCTFAGIGAMLAPKRAGRHPTAGAVYYWSLVVVFLTMAALSILRWPENTHLFVLGILSFGAGTIGRTARRQLSAAGFD